MSKPVRKVKSNGRTMTGEFPSRKNGRMIQFESLLEKDFIKMLEFDSNVLEFGDQPFKISFKDRRGKDHTYVPDFFVKYKNGLCVIFEIKYENFLKENWKEIKDKIKAGRKYAKENGWKFSILTEKEIKTILKENLDFLLYFMGQAIEQKVESQLLDAVASVSSPTANSIIDYLSGPNEPSDEFIRPLWILVAKGKIGFDMSQNLHMETPLWKNNDKIKVFSYPYRNDPS